MHRFFMKQDQFDGQCFLMEDKEEVRHLTKALRVHIGEELEICIIETGVEWIAKVSVLGEDTVTLKAIRQSEIKRESPIHITLYQGLPKGDKMELIIQKTTELGIKTIVPVAMDRSIVKLKAKDGQKKQRRWQKIAYEAAKQSKRTAIPQVTCPVAFNDLEKSIKGHDLVIFLYENEQQVHLSDILKTSSAKSIAIIIGPEGGYSEVEAQQLVAWGAHSTSLGPRILRTETAGLSCLSIIQYEMGDL